MSDEAPKQKPTSPKYETQDLQLKPVLISLFSIVAFLLVTMFGTWFLYRALNPNSDAATQPKDFPIYDAAQNPPPPRLQAAPARDRKLFLEQETSKLNSYQWVDKEKGIAAVPVERAMEMALEQGFPEITRKSMVDYSP